MKLSPAIVSVSGETVDILKHDGHRHHVKVELDYINNLGIDVIVLDRRGIEFYLPATNNSSSKQFEFIIYETFHLQEKMSIRINEHEKDTDIARLQNHFLDSLNLDAKAQRVTRKAMVCSKLSLPELRSDNGCVYIKEHDVVIYTPRIGYTVVHPATVSKLIGGIDVGRSPGNNFEFHIQINDPSGMIGDRFINVCGSISRFTPTRDPSKAEGVIITTTSSDAKGEYSHLPMTLEEFESKIKSYRSFEEASTHGNLEQIVKKNAETELELLRHKNSVAETTLKGEINQHKLESEKAKHDLELVQADLKHQDLKHKKELELMQIQLDREKHSVELQSLQRKSYYEERSYDRKDSSELIKFLPMILGAGLVLLFK